MRFVALVKKELREILVWLALAAVAFVCTGSLILWHRARHPYNYKYWDKEPGYEIDSSEFTQYPQPLRGVGPALLLTSVGLGLVLAAQQFGEPEKLKTWAFAIHRSVRRITILWAKFAAAAIAFVFSLGLFWSLLYFYASKPGVFLYPPTRRDLIEGWIFVIVGLVVYSGTALSALSTRKGQRPGIVGFVFAAGVGFLALVQSSLALCFLVIIAGGAMLLSQVIDTFLNREF